MAQNTHEKTEKQIEGELILKLVPKCHFCKNMVGEGSRLKQDNKYLYLCDDCRALISALVHDTAYNVFHSITQTMAHSGTGYEEKLECYQWGMTDEEFATEIEKYAKQECLSPEEFIEKATKDRLEKVKKLYPNKEEAESTAEQTTPVEYEQVRRNKGCKRQLSFD